MRRRRRVSLRESFKIAGKGSLETGGGEEILLATIVFGLWWWIAGVPVDRKERRRPE
jgi:hypothetical protein